MTYPFAVEASVAAVRERPAISGRAPTKRKLGLWPVLILSLLAHLVVLYLISHHRKSETKPPPTIETVSITMLAPENPQAVQPEPPTPAPPQETKVKPVVQQTPEPVRSTAPSTMPVVEATPAPSPPVQTTQATPSPTVTEPRFDAAYLNNPAPVYPNMSRRLRETGMVQLRVRVDSTGLPTDVVLAKSCGYSRLDDAALAAVRRWKFQPAMRDGTAIEATVVVPVEFSLEKMHS